MAKLLTFIYYCPEK